MNQNEFTRILNNKVEEVEELLKNSFGMSKFLPQKRIIEAMEYSLLGGGKRLRPILLNETYLFYGGNLNVTRPFMTSIEMIHTYSLIHDDLPSMDNDDLRRGQPTSHKKFNEATAILSGDSLLNYSMEKALEAFNYALDMDTVVKSLEILYNKSGYFGMIGGQVLDIDSNFIKSLPKEKAINELELIYKLKTSALLEASMMIGCALSGGSSEEIKRMELCGRKLGLAFQIKDDILDYTSSEEVLGKSVLSDEKNEKLTYPNIIGIEESEELVKSLSSEVITILNNTRGNNPFLLYLINSLINRNK